VGDVRFGRYKLTKKQMLAIAADDVLLSHDAKVNKLMWAWLAVRHCVSKLLSSFLMCQVPALKSAQGFNVILARGWHAVFEPILQ